MNHPLYPDEDKRSNKDERSRILRYLQWTEESGQHWLEPDLEAYRDALLQDENLSASTVAMYVSGVKRQYRRLLESGDIQSLLITAIEEQERQQQALQKIEIAIERNTATVTYERETQVQRLSQSDIEGLIGQVKFQSLMDLRDVLVIGLILFTGISEIELCELTIEHIELQPNNKTTIHVPAVIEDMPRHVDVADGLFYQPSWWQDAYKVWLKHSEIDSGAAFRGFYRGGNTIRKNGMKPNAVRDLLRRYSVPDEQGESVYFTAMNLRYTYARRLAEYSVPVERIQRNLAHGSVDTTRRYIGEVNLNSLFPDEPPAKGDGQRLLDRVNTFFK